MMSVFDYAVLPPEINSGRMYAGAGSGPLLAAAAAWDGLASELSAAASSYQSTVLELTGGAWLGPASVSMAAAAAPYVAWMNTTAAAAEQTAHQGRAAAAAYEAAFSATVPPPLIAANRALLMSLVATNIVGQNTPAIAATEAQYAQMWAQDAAAMYGYAGASASATALTPFSSPTQNTDPAGAGTQAAAVASATGTSTGTAQNALSQVTTMLQSLASASPSQVAVNVLSSPLITEFKSLSTALGGYTSGYSGAAFVSTSLLFLAFPFVTSAIGKGLAAAPAAAVSAGPAAGLGTLAGSYESGVGAAGSASLGGAGVSAGLGQARSVGGLSVPQSWATGSPAIRLAATALPAGGLDGLPAAGAAGPGGWLRGMPPMLGGVVNAPRHGAAGISSESRLRVIPQMAAASGGRERTPGRWVNAPGGDATVSERAELYGLRHAVAELAKERDVLISSARLLIKEAMSR
jgi:PPE-repeat protein